MEMPIKIGNDFRLLFSELQVTQSGFSYFPRSMLQIFYLVSL
jgi:hypothetical protein